VIFFRVFSIDFTGDKAMYELNSRTNNQQNCTNGRSKGTDTVQSNRTEKRDGFRPSREARRFLANKREQGGYLAYEACKEIFFRYQDSNGVWNQYLTDYIEADVQDHLRNPEFGDARHSGDKRYYVREMLAALKKLLTEEQNEVRFDLGHNPNPNNDCVYYFRQVSVLNAKGEGDVRKTGRIRTHHTLTIRHQNLTLFFIAENNERATDQQPKKVTVHEVSKAWSDLHISLRLITSVFQLARVSDGSVRCFRAPEGDQKPTSITLFLQYHHV
jgi:hypothetical protein